MEYNQIITLVIAIVVPTAICCIQIWHNRRIFKETKRYNDISLEKQQDFYKMQQRKSKEYKLKIHEEFFALKKIDVIYELETKLSDKNPNFSIIYYEFFKIILIYSKKYKKWEIKNSLFLSEILMSLQEKALKQPKISGNKEFCYAFLELVLAFVFIAIYNKDEDIKINDFFKERFAFSKLEIEKISSINKEDKEKWSDWIFSRLQSEKLE